MRENDRDRRKGLESELKEAHRRLSSLLQVQNQRDSTHVREREQYRREIEELRKKIQDDVENEVQMAEQILQSEKRVDTLAASKDKLVASIEAQNLEHARSLVSIWVKVFCCVDLLQYSHDGMTNSKQCVSDSRWHSLVTRRYRLGHHIIHGLITPKG